MTDEEMPRHFGDFPGGAYWSAESPAGAEAQGEAEEGAHVPVGTIRFAWDHGVRVPLWDDTGLLPEALEWLHEALGLDEVLARDLVQWGRDMEELDATPRLRSRPAYTALDARARALVTRVRACLAGRLEVTYDPWVVVGD